ncbi:uncharacterized protein LOC128245324 [Mya arenaria]|uniref:uncharacterized protein LOC128245324 n=1 Tax=Mya arenaria TaxID=6604 RepID=UPI0022E71693|nr:uncharacterized protein LOC128245324 [Mya arenaria]
MSDRHPAVRCLHHWPTRTLCLFLILIQAASLNWYLMDNLSFTWAAVYAADAVVITLFIASFFMATSNIHHEKHSNDPPFASASHLPLSYISWFAYAVLLDIKVVMVFTKFSTDLDEDSFFGPNTMKTSLALAGLVFLTFLPTQHDATAGHRRQIITTLTATVIFDILDGVDNLENLFDKDVRDSYPPGLDDAIIGICCVNFLLPTVPLFTLAKTRFGLTKLPERLEILHKVAIAYLVNLPLFITRMVTWHGLSAGISIFLLKNVIAIGVVTFDLVEHFCCKAPKRDSDNELDRYRPG